MPGAAGQGAAASVSPLAPGAAVPDGGVGVGAAGSAWGAAAA